MTRLSNGIRARIDPHDVFITSKGKVSLPLIPHNPEWNGDYDNKHFGIASNVANKGGGLYFHISKKF